MIGFALADLGLAATLDRRTTQLALGLVGLGVIAVGGVIMVETTGSESVVRRVGLIASCAMAGAYAAAFLLARRTPLGSVLSMVFAPLGRMALTNYLSATVLFVLTGNALDLRETEDWSVVGLLGAAILVVQAVWSPLWLRAFRYGPAEWIWRCVTYWQLMPIKEPSPAG